MTPRRQTLANAAIIAALAVFAGLLRVGEVGQSSLWKDDAWVALAIKADGLHEFLLTGLTAPGFAAVLKMWSAIVGFSATRAQVLPFLIGTAGPPLVFAVLVWRGVGRVAAAAGGFLLAVSMLHISYSARVKQYTLDALVVVGLLAAAWWLLERRDDARRWWILAGVAITGTLLSSAAIVFVISGLIVAAIALWRSHGWRALRVGLAPAAVVAAFLVGWWAAVLRPANNPRLHDYFGSRYVTLDEGPTTALGEAAEAVERVLEEAIVLPGKLGVVLVLIAAVVALWRRPALGSLLLVPFGTALVLAGLQLVPLGAGRTDIYLFPALAMLVAVALDELGHVFLPAAAVAALGLGGLWLIDRQPPLPYPRADIAPLVRHLEAEASGSDAILIHPEANFAYGLYTRYPIELVESSNYATGFQVRVIRANVFLPDPHMRDPSSYERTIRSIQPDTVWFIAAPARNVTPDIKVFLQAEGYNRNLARHRPGAVLSRWSR